MKKYFQILMVVSIFTASFCVAPFTFAAIFSDNFDSYATGNLVGQGGWAGDAVYSVVNTDCVTNNCIYGGGSGASYKVGSSSTSGSIDISFRIDTNPTSGDFAGPRLYTTLQTAFSLGFAGHSGTSTSFAYYDNNQSTVLWDNLSLGTYHTLSATWAISSTDCTISIDIDHSNTPYVLNSGGNCYGLSAYFPLSVNGIFLNSNPYVAMHYDDIADTSDTLQSCIPGEDPNCNSNVMFLPGFEGSKLFTTTTSGDQDLWLPKTDTDIGNLYLDSNGQPVNTDTYSKAGQLVDNAYGRYNIYTSIIDQMNSLKTNGSIVDWEPIAYDWRYDYGTLLANGKELDGNHIYYGGPFAATRNWGLAPK